MKNLLIVIISCILISCVTYSNKQHHKTKLSDSTHNRYSTNIQPDSNIIFIKDNKTKLGKFILNTRVFFRLGLGSLKNNTKKIKRKLKK